MRYWLTNFHTQFYFSTSTTCVCILIPDRSGYRVEDFPLKSKNVQVSQPYNGTGCAIACYILISKFIEVSRILMLLKREKKSMFALIIRRLVLIIGRSLKILWNRSFLLWWKIFLLSLKLLFKNYLDYLRYELCHLKYYFK